MSASAPVPVLLATTGLRDADGDLFSPGCFAASLATRSPRVTAVPGDWSTPVGRLVDVVELRPGDARLPERTPEGRRWPRGAGALVGSAVLNLATKDGQAAFEAASRARTPAAFGLGFTATGSRQDGAGRTITEAQAYTCSPTAGLTTNGVTVHGIETKAAPGARGSRPAAPGRATISPDEVDQYHDVDDDLSLSMSPPGMHTLSCSLCGRDYGWADVAPTMSVCEDCARTSADRRARRGAAGETAGRDRESEASERVRATFPDRGPSPAPGSDAAVDPRYAQRSDGSLQRDDAPPRRRGAPAPGMGRVG